MMFKSRYGTQFSYTEAEQSLTSWHMMETEAVHVKSQGCCNPGNVQREFAGWVIDYSH